MTAVFSTKRNPVKTTMDYIRAESWVAPATASFALLAGAFFMSTAPVSRSSVAGVLLMAIQLLCVLVALVSRKWLAILLTLGFLTFSFVRI